MANPAPPFTIDPKKKLWHQQPGETVSAYGKFCVYRDMSVGRSLSRLATMICEGDDVWIGGDETRKRKRHRGILAVLEKLCTRNMWVDRVTAWDTEAGTQAGEARIRAQVEAVEECVRRHANMLKGFHNVAIRRLVYLNDDEKGQAESLKIPIPDLMALGAMVIKFDRLTHGIDRETADTLKEAGQAVAQGTGMTFEEAKRAAMAAMAEETARQKAEREAKKAKEQ